MSWQRRCRVWGPNGALPWARSHATCPTPHLRRDGTLRLYVQCRDAGGVGRIGWVDVPADDPTHVLRAAQQPVLDIGDPGCFDDNGVFPTCALRLGDGRLALYYVGFELCHHIRYRLLSGVALSEDDGDTFVRLQPTPILERSGAELHFRCAPLVRPVPGGYRMWYVAGSQWEPVGGKAMPRYDIRTMTSPDGLHWPDAGQVVLPVEAEHEHGLGRPFVVHDHDGWRMHLSVRRREPATYGLGLARSADGVRWQRCDAQLALPHDDARGAWDGASRSYSAEFAGRDGARWLFYNGDDFGAAGFGVASWATA